MSVTVGSLLGEDLRGLEELGLLPQDVEADEQESKQVKTGGNSVLAASNGTVTRTERHGQSGNISWFEEMLDGSRLGRSNRTRRGVGVSTDGTTQIEWETSEYQEGDGEYDSETGRGKRKFGEEDIDMGNYKAT